ncbi:MAG: O-methyltransferase [Rhizobiales bacterium]|nr:O-methyltransferase [Hyphomicrobiales bacterium]
MSESNWNDVENFIDATLIGHDERLDATLLASAAAGLPPIAVSPNQGKFLQILARSVKARRILEVGTLGGYSTIWLAGALPQGGRLVTLEADSHHAHVARENFARAGLDHVIELRFGKAHDTMPAMIAERCASFDFIFIDADKKRIPLYFDWAVAMAHPGSLIVVDNVVRKGALADAASRDEHVIGVRELHQRLARDRRVSATTLQTVGAKGYDGFTVAIVQ